SFEDGAHAAITARGPETVTPRRGPGRPIKNKEPTEDVISIHRTNAPGKWVPKSRRDAHAPPRCRSDRGRNATRDRRLSCGDGRCGAGRHRVRVCSHARTVAVLS